MPKIATLDQVHPLDCLFVRAVRAEHVSLHWFYDRGYIHYRNGSGGKGSWIEYEHQLVARAAYGLPDGYHVHHIDGDPLNNCADNLLPVTPSEHAKIHGGHAIHGTFTCTHCGKAFDRRLCDAAKNTNQFCSLSCLGLANRLVERPDADTLFDMMASISNWCELGRMFGVSDNAVRKWARQYDLDLSVCDGRRR